MSSKAIVAGCDGELLEFTLNSGDIVLEEGSLASMLQHNLMKCANEPVARGRALKERGMRIADRFQEMAIALQNSRLDGIAGTGRRIEQVFESCAFTVGRRDRNGETRDRRK